MKLKKVIKNIGNREHIRIYYSDGNFVNTTKEDALTYFGFLANNKVKVIGSGRLIINESEIPVICIYLK